MALAPVPGGPEDEAAHQHLHDLMALAARDLSRQDAASLSIRLRALLQATMAHFVAEDRLMDESRFPDAAAHRESHTAYLIEFRRMNQELERNGLSPVFKLWFGGRFQDWMRFHTRGADAKLLEHWRRHQEAQQAALAQDAAPAQPSAA